jgi:hypothetical protein
MKAEYKERALEQLGGIEKRANTVLEMMEGKQPANQQNAIKLTKEILRLVELNKNIVDIS